MGHFFIPSTKIRAEGKNPQRQRYQQNNSLDVSKKHSNSLDASKCGEPSNGSDASNDVDASNIGCTSNSREPGSPTNSMDVSNSLDIMTKA
jgi:hypothetical protein